MDALTLAILALAAAIVFHALMKGSEMADATGLNTAIDNLTAAMADVATSISNLPAADASAQATIDAAAARINALVDAANAMKAAEDAEDSGTPPAV